MDVLEDLLEDLAVAGRGGRGRPGGSRVRAVAARADVLEVGAAAEDAAGAAQHDGADGRVAGAAEPGLAEVPRRLDVQRVEALAAVDGDDADRAVALDADVAS